MRLIDADALHEAMQWNIEHDMYDKPFDYIAEISDAPTIESKRGEWIGLDRCSVCGKQAYDFIEGPIDGIEYLPNFCPNCGSYNGDDNNATRNSD